MLLVVMMVRAFLFFFFNQKSAYEWRIMDWSSDVCSSDLLSGIMPTWGRVSRHGVFPLVESLDHVGPMARSLADAAAILQVIAGADTADPTSQCSPDAVFGEGQDKIEGRVIGYDPRLLEEDVDPLLADAARQTMEIFRSAGLIVREARFPRLDRVGMETFGMIDELAVAH